MDEMENMNIENEETTEIDTIDVSEDFEDDKRTNVKTIIAVSFVAGIAAKKIASVVIDKVKAHKAKKEAEKEVEKIKAIIDDVFDAETEDVEVED